MVVNASQLDVVKDMLAQTNRCVLMTRRRDGGIQSSPMSLVIDDNGDLLLTTRQTAAKVKNLRRDPYAAVCVITEKFLGAWLHVDGTASISYLPEAMPLLQDFFRRRGAEDTTSETFQQRMRDENRCMIKISIDRVVLPPARPPARPTTGA